MERLLSWRVDGNALLFHLVLDALDEFLEEALGLRGGLCVNVDRFPVVVDVAGGALKFDLERLPRIFLQNLNDFFFLIAGIATEIFLRVIIIYFLFSKMWIDPYIYIYIYILRTI